MNKNIYGIHAEFCKVFSNPTRLEMLSLLRNKEMSVSELIKKTGLSQANISQHLAVMKAKGAVLSRKSGKNTYYTLKNQKIIRAFDIIQMVLIENMNEQNRIAKSLR